MKQTVQTKFLTELLSSLMHCNLRQDRSYFPVVVVLIKWNGTHITKSTMTLWSWWTLWGIATSSWLHKTLNLISASSKQPCAFEATPINRCVLNIPGAAHLHWKNECYKLVQSLVSVHQWVCKEEDLHPSPPFCSLCSSRLPPLDLRTPGTDQYQDCMSPQSLYGRCQSMNFS